MSAQGIPGIILISREVRLFRKHYDETCANTKEHIDVLRRDIAEKLDKLPEQVCDLILERYKIDNVAPVTKEDMRRMMHEIMNEEGSAYATINSKLQTICDQQNQMLGQLTEKSVVTPVTRTNSPAIMRTGQYYIWRSDIGDLSGRMHYVPEGFVFPSYSTQTMWNLWFLVMQN